MKLLGYCIIMLVGISVLAVWYVKDTRKMKKDKNEVQNKKAAS